MKTITLILMLATTCLAGPLETLTDSLIRLGDSSKLAEITFLSGINLTMKVWPGAVTVENKGDLKFTVSSQTMGWEAMAAYVVSEEFPNKAFQALYITNIVKDMANMYEPEPAGMKKLASTEIATSNAWFGERAVRALADRLGMAQNTEFVKIMAQKNCQR